jgi:hypothetical protein
MEATVSDGCLSTIRSAVGFVTALGTKVGINFSWPISSTAQILGQESQAFDSKA